MSISYNTDTEFSTYIDGLVAGDEEGDSVGALEALAEASLGNKFHGARGSGINGHINDVAGCIWGKQIKSRHWIIVCTKIYTNGKVHQLCFFQISWQRMITIADGNL